MIISDSQRFVFLHNPKCGGMTIRKSLADFDTNNDFFWGAHQVGGKGISKEHMPLALFRKEFPEHFAKLQDYFVFVIVRDPYTRMVSGFNQRHQKERVTELANSGEPDKIAEYRRLLNDFVMALKPPRVENYSVMTRHFVRQRDLIYLEDLCLADLTLRQEAWDRSLEKLALFRPEVARAIGGQRRANVRAVPAPKESYLDTAAIARINKLYADDFTLFDYPVVEAG